MESTIVEKDVPLFVIILQHPFEHLHRLGCDSRPASGGEETRRRRRSWEERIERRLVGHPSSEPVVLQSTILYASDEAGRAVNGRWRKANLSLDILE